MRDESFEACFSHSYPRAIYTISLPQGINPDSITAELSGGLLEISVHDLSDVEAPVHLGISQGASYTP